MREVSARPTEASRPGTEVPWAARIVLASLLLAAGACGSDPETMTPAEWLRENTRLLEQLRSYEADEQKEAIAKFKELGRDRGTKYALALLVDPQLDDYRTEVVLARILADWRDPRSINFLLQHLFRPDTGAAAIAAEGLAVFRGDPNLEEVLIAKLDSPVTGERRIAADLLSRFGTREAVERMAELYSDEEDAEVRALYLMTIRASDHPKRLEYLVDTLTDVDEGLREFAWNVVERRLPDDLEFDPGAAVETRATQVARIRMWIRDEESVTRDDR